MRRVPGPISAAGISFARDVAKAPRGDALSTGKTHFFPRGRRRHPRHAPPKSVRIARPPPFIPNRFGNKNKNKAVRGFGRPTTRNKPKGSRALRF